jgi:hypothetical protein
LISDLTQWFSAFVQPIAHANDPDASRDREGAVARARRGRLKTAEGIIARPTSSGKLVTNAG